MWELIVSFLEHFQKNPFIELTGFWAMIIVFFAYLQKDDLWVKKLMLLSTLLWMSHFYMLGVYTALAANALWIVRFFLSQRFWRSKHAFIFVIWLTFFISYFTIDGIWSILPIIASMIGAFGYFFLEKIKLRFAMLANSMIWIVYHNEIGSLTGMMNDLMTQVLLVFTIYRMAHPEWGTAYYAQKVKEILWKTRSPDYDRFIFIYDRVSEYRKHIWTYFLQILDYDLKQFFLKERWQRLIVRFTKRVEL